MYFQAASTRFWTFFSFFSIAVDLDDLVEGMVGQDFGVFGIDGREGFAALVDGSVEELSLDVEEFHRRNGSVTGSTLGSVLLGWILVITSANAVPILDGIGRSSFGLQVR